MKKIQKLPKFSEILHLAADYYLDPTPGCPYPKRTVEETRTVDQPWPRDVQWMAHGGNAYSCYAIESAIFDWYDWCKSTDTLGKRVRRYAQWSRRCDAIINWLETFGLVSGSTNEFVKFPSGPERQGARYAWLKFAAMIAEEEGK